MSQPQPASTAPAPRLDALTGLRFLAAFHVVLHHYGHPGHLFGFAEHVLSRGDQSVSLFFVLSGFILAYSYHSQSGSAGLARSFWVARFARVYPLYLLSMLLSLPTDGRALGLTLSSARTLTAHLLCLQAFSAAWAGRLNFPSWSLSVEALFYLMFPWFFSLLVPASRRALAITGVMCAVLAVGVSATVEQVGSALDGLGYAVKAEWWPPLRVPEFVVGICAGIAFCRRRERLPQWQATAMVAGAVCVVLALLGLTAERTWYQHAGALAAPFCVLIFGLASSPGGLARPLETRIAVLLGEASYGIYLLHVPVHRLLERTGLTLASPLGHLGYWTLLIAFSILCHKVVEKPARRVIRDRWLARGTRSAAVPARSIG